MASRQAHLRKTVSASLPQLARLCTHTHRPPRCRADYARTYRFFRLNTLNYYGTDACARFKSQCDCCEPLYMRFHIKEKKHQDEIKALVQSKDIDTMINGKRHDVHFDQVCRQCRFCTFASPACKRCHAW